MISKISLIYDDLHLFLSTLFPEHKEMVNPYLPGSTDNLSLKKAWGVVLLDAENTTTELGCNLKLNRNFEITLTEYSPAGLLNSANAIESRKKAEKDLLEAHMSLAMKLQNDTYLNAQGVFNASKITYRSDGGIEFLRTGQLDLIMIRSIVEIEYQQNF